MITSRRSVLMGIGAALVVGTAPVRAAGVRVIGGPAFGTSWRITLPADVSHSREIMDSIQAIVESIETSMSPFRRTSELSLFNASDSCEWQSLSAEPCALIMECLEVAKRTGGSFDPTVGPIVGRYGFGPIQRHGQVSYLDISIRDDAIRKHKPELTLDLCGIAKGHAVDRMVSALKNLDVTEFLIEVGGEVFACGVHPTGRAWQVGIERPVPGATTMQRIVRLNGQALATSGDTVNSYVIAGRRYSHIIDPHHRQPVDTGTASVSVLMPSAAKADAYATALMAMDSLAGTALAEREGISAIFIVREGAGLREVMTAGFASIVVA